MQRAPVRRTGRPRDPSRDGLIRSAILRLLAAAGYGALTMDAVAAAAGVGKATIYRRWPTKEDLVCSTISELHWGEPLACNTGSLKGDLLSLLHSLVAVIEGETGEATVALLSTVQHHPVLSKAFRDGPLAEWRDAVADVWTRAEQREEVPSGMAGSPLAEAATALLVQRWLLSGRPVDNAYADEIVETVVLPLIPATRAARA